jgi:Disulfide bond formation protein DsbB.
VKAFFENYLDFFITFCAAIVVGSQYYLENIVGLEPCNLCILQKYSAQAVFFIFVLKMVVPRI